MTYFPNILPGFVKLLIDFHDVSSAEVQEYLPLSELGLSNDLVGHS